jgi:hypothetical protein
MFGCSINSRARRHRAAPATNCALVRMPAGWRVDDVHPDVGSWREEPDEPHGPHTSAYTIVLVSALLGRRAARTHRCLAA